MEKNDKSKQMLDTNKKNKNEIESKDPPSHCDTALIPLKSTISL